MYGKLGVLALVIAGLIAGNLYRDIYNPAKIRFEKGIDEANRINVLFDVIEGAAEGITIQFTIFFVIAMLGIRLLRAHSIVNKKEKDKTHA